MGKNDESACRTDGVRHTARSRTSARRDDGEKPSRRPPAVCPGAAWVMNLEPPISAVRRRTSFPQGMPVRQAVSASAHYQQKACRQQRHEQEIR